jgi:curved DNA-binding protein CbpA
MTASTADYYGILGLTSDATLADVKKAYRKLARQHHPDRNNADPGAIDRFRRITEAYEYLSAHLKDNAHGSGHSRPRPAASPRAASPRAGAGMRIVVIIIASSPTGWDTRWVHFDPQEWSIHITAALTKILLIQTTPAS